MSFARSRCWSVLVVVLVLVVVGCAGGETGQAVQPQIVGCAVEASSEGSEESQTVTAALTFDMPVAVAAKSASNLRVVIGGNRVKSSDYSVAADPADERTVVIRVAVSSVTTGEMLLESADGSGLGVITASDRRTAAHWPPVRCLIPTGVALIAVESAAGTAEEGAYVVKEVAGVWRVRGIAWVVLLENGRVQKPDGAAETKFDGAVAVHGHDFLTTGPDGAARAIVDALRQGFGERYVFSASGKRFSVRSLTPADGDVVDVLVLDAWPGEEV